MEYDKDYLKNPYKGQDGNNYYSLEELRKANEQYNMVMNPYIGKDGNDYYTLEELEAANQKYDEEHRVEETPHKKR